MALLIGFLIIRYKVPVYQVASSMIIQSEKPSQNDKFEVLMQGGKAQNISNEIEIMRSKPLMQRVVSELNLQYSYFVIGKIKTLNVYRLSPFVIETVALKDSNTAFTLKLNFINSEGFTINKGSKVYGFNQPIDIGYGTLIFHPTRISAGNNEYRLEYRSANAMAAKYAGALSVLPRTAGTGILNISMRTANSFLGSDILNKLMQEYGQYSVEQKVQASGQTLVWIDERLDDLGGKLDSVQQMYLAYQRRYNLMDAESQSGNYFEVITEADKMVNEQSMQYSVAEMIDAYLADKKNAFSKVIVPSTLGLEDPTLNGLVESYNKAQIERRSLLEANVPVGNPAVVELEANIEQLRTSVRENLRVIKVAMESAISRVKSRSAIGQSQLQAMPEKVKELAEIRSQIETYQGLYKMLQEKREETAISQAAIVSSSSILDVAYPNNIPISPKKKNILIIAVVAGLFLPAFVIFLGEVLNDKITSRFDVERLTRAPILGEIGHSYAEETLVVSKTTRSMVAEQFRIIRSNLQYILHQKEKWTILVTSSFSGEGKSYVSLNMGAVMALSGKKTIVLEFDIRKPKVLSGLGMSKGPGITNFLLGKAELPELIRQVHDRENFYVLGCGPVPPNPSELLLDPKVDEMFAWLKANYDIVIIDTAPVGMVSDAMTLGNYADCTLYLARQGHTFKKQIALIEEFYRDKKLPMVSVIINDVKLKPGYGYYGYGRYGYGYGYGQSSYYDEEHPPPNRFERVLSTFDMRRLFKKKRRKV
jgi:capsular exopolysaccharide synthesis family protein